MIISVLFIFVAFIIWVSYKIRISNLVKKYNCQSEVKNIKAGIKKLTLPKIFFKVSLISFIIWLLYTGFGIVLGVFLLLMMFITLGGAAYVDTGADPSFYYGLIDFCKLYFSAIPFALIVPFFIIILVLIRVLYINHGVLHKLQNTISLDK